MAGGRLSCFFTCSVLGLLGVCLHHDMEASGEKCSFHKEVGDTVEIPSFLPTENVTLAEWYFGSSKIAAKDGFVPNKHHFKGRVHLNPGNFSLTVEKLVLKDSGDFQFVSEVNDKQRKTITITLCVHEPIAEQPVVKFIHFSWDGLNQSCSARLECSTASDRAVHYEWTVGGRTHPGSGLRYTIRPQDGETNFTCTISNSVSKKSAFLLKQCSNDAVTDQPVNLVLLLSAAGGSCLLIVVVVGTILGCCCFRRKQIGSDIDDSTVYANVEDVTMKPCSVYETIESVNVIDPVTPGPQTVYDKIQLHRVAKAPGSPYQDVS